MMSSGSHGAKPLNSINTTYTHTQELLINIIYPDTS